MVPKCPCLDSRELPGIFGELPGRAGPRDLQTAHCLVVDLRVPRGDVGLRPGPCLGSLKSVWTM